MPKLLALASPSPHRGATRLLLQKLAKEHFLGPFNGGLKLLHPVPNQCFAPDASAHFDTIRENALFRRVCRSPLYSTNQNTYTRIAVFAKMPVAHFRQKTLSSCMQICAH
jgi:hypothetical protein